MKRVLMFLATTLTGLIVTMLIIGAMITVVGVWSSGGVERWQAALFSAAPYLLVWRFFIYLITAGFWYATYRMYRDKNEAAAVGRMKRIGIFGILVILFIEVPKLLW
jgi:hypothetical protein